MPVKNISQVRAKRYLTKSLSLIICYKKEHFFQICRFLISLEKIYFSKKRFEKNIQKFIADKS